MRRLPGPLIRTPEVRNWCCIHSGMFVTKFSILDFVMSIRITRSIGLRSQTFLTNLWKLLLSTPIREMRVTFVCFLHVRLRDMSHGR